MGKFRSKLKRSSGKKTWARGHSSTSNPETMKHREKAKSRFFQANLSTAPVDVKSKTPLLTMEELQKHDARQSFARIGHEPTVNDIAITASLKSVNLNRDDSMTESQSGTFATFETFASGFSECSNMSFQKLLTNFRASSNLHKEMLAILAALTDIIKEKGGNQSSTEYFILLIETIDACKEINGIIAGISLLSMGIKSVPQPVLRKTFSETAEMLMNLLERFTEFDNKLVVKNIIGCLSVILRAQDYSFWTYSSNLRYIDTILAFTIHSNPKVRKAAHHAIISIICTSCFMLEQDHSEETKTTSVQTNTAIKFHPAGSRVIKFCIKQFQPEVIATSQTVVLHTLGLLTHVIKAFQSNDIRSICEHLLSIMTAANVLLRTKCLEVLHALFTSRTTNLNAVLCGKLISAIFEYCPDKIDARQTLAWLTVLREGHIHLATLDQCLCLNSLPRLIDICTTELWFSNRSELVNNVSVTLKEVLNECVKPVCLSEETALQNRVSIEKIIKQIGKALELPFGDVTKHVILTCGILFESVGQNFSEATQHVLSMLGSRYDSDSQSTVHIEHAVLSAVTHLGPENVLKAIPLTNKNDDILLERTWLLPLLREGTKGATFHFFANYILKLAANCNKKWLEFKNQESVALSHTYELICCQLWGLFPGFCRDPKDGHNFKMIARTLGVALRENLEFRAPILDGFIELITNSSDDCKKEITKFSKNFLPILFNIYSEKPNGTYEIDLRKKVLNVIKLYLTLAPEQTTQELFESASKEIKTMTPGSFECESVTVILYSLLLYQSEEKINEFLKTFISPILNNSSKSKYVAKDKEQLKKQQRKSYEFLLNLLTDERDLSKKFCIKHRNAIRKLLLETLQSSCPACQATRLKCLKTLIENNKNPKTSDELITKSIPETIVTFKEFSTKKESISEELLIVIGNIYQKEDKLNDFIDIVMAGFGGDCTTIVNTILALKSIVQHLSGNLTVTTLEYILQQVMVFLVQKNRQQSEASVAFLIIFVKTLPSPLVANHLEFIMKSLSAMVPDTKRYCRIHLGFLLKKLSKKFSADELIKLVPGNDETTHKRLKKIRKLLRRENRKKLEYGKSNNEEDSEEEIVSGLEKKSLTIDDILADSESEISEDSNQENDVKNKRQKSKKPKQLFIQEDPEDIIDFTEVKSIKNIITDRSFSEINKKETKRNKDENRGFKLSEDGKLIISDKTVKDDSEDDTDSEMNDKDDKKSSKRMLEESSSDDDGDEKMTVVNKRKRLSDKSTVASGKSVASSRRSIVSKGIHRTVGGTSQSVKSFGAEYKSTKAKGDVKRKGKLDPYAYIPLRRSTLNKRKKAKISGQFKNIVKGAKAGALKGVKNKIHKKYKK